MGAQDFSTTIFAADAAEAFDRAQARARYDYGHAGYTGTIAEKDRFVEFTLPPRFKVTKAVELGWEWLDLMFQKPDPEGMYIKARWKHNPTVKQIERETAKWERKRERVRKKAGAFSSQLDSLAVVLDDKWGPAACFELRGKAAQEYRKRHGVQRRKGGVFYFTGIASC
jgi:hypothetical protein